MQTLDFDEVHQVAGGQVASYEGMRLPCRNNAYYDGLIRLHRPVSERSQPVSAEHIAAARWVLQPNGCDAAYFIVSPAPAD